MLDQATHLAQAAHNEAFLGEIDQSTRSDWFVTVLFYAAVHYVDAYLATKSEYPAGHVDRRRCLQFHPQTRAVFKEYERLQNRSRAARYDAARFNAAEMATLRTKDLEVIKGTLK